MKLIVGLGNPGRKYEKTRHNSGFAAIDAILKSQGLKLDQERFNALYTVFDHQGEKIVLLKPLTYMNLSGQAVKAFVDYYKVPLDDILVIHDDLDLPVGKIRIREKGSSGGQKGMGNIIDLLNSREIKRIRIGIDKDPLIAVPDYVLGRVNKEELPQYQESIEKAAKAVLFWLDNPFDLVMNRYNI